MTQLPLNRSITEREIKYYNQSYYVLLIIDFLQRLLMVLFFREDKS